MTEHFLICVMSLKRTCLSGFNFRGRGGAFWPSSKATDFRFLDVFMGRKCERETPGIWMGEGEKDGTPGPIKPKEKREDSGNYWIRPISIELIFIATALGKHPCFFLFFSSSFLLVF